MSFFNKDRCKEIGKQALADYKQKYPNQKYPLADPLVMIGDTRDYGGYCLEVGIVYKHFDGSVTTVYDYVDSRDLQFIVRDSSFDEIYFKMIMDLVVYVFFTTYNSKGVVG